MRKRKESEDVTALGLRGNSDCGKFCKFRDEICAYTFIINICSLFSRKRNERGERKRRSAYNEREM